MVQYVLELGNVEPTSKIMMRLFGHYPDLAQQKFSSNVVEKCLKLGGAPELKELREKVILELLSSPMLPRLLQVCFFSRSWFNLTFFPPSCSPPLCVAISCMRYLLVNYPVIISPLR